MKKQIDILADHLLKDLAEIACAVIDAAERKDRAGVMAAAQWLQKYGARLEAAFIQASRGRAEQIGEQEAYRG